MCYFLAQTYTYSIINRKVYQHFGLSVHDTWFGRLFN